jgi:hypothetical protein
MDIARLKKIQREADSIQADDIPRTRAPTQIIAPTVTRQPKLDSMLGNISIIADMELHRLRKQVQSGDFLNKDDRKAFKEYCETVFRETRVEMEVEAHVLARSGSMTKERLIEIVTKALVAKGVAQDVQNTVLSALGVRV